MQIYVLSSVRIIVSEPTYSSSFMSPVSFLPHLSLLCPLPRHPHSCLSLHFFLILSAICTRPHSMDPFPSSLFAYVCFLHTSSFMPPGSLPPHLSLLHLIHTSSFMPLASILPHSLFYLLSAPVLIHASWILFFSLWPSRPPSCHVTPSCLISLFYLQNPQFLISLFYLQNPQFLISLFSLQNPHFLISFLYLKNPHLLIHAT